MLRPQLTESKAVQALFDRLVAEKRIQVDSEELYDDDDAIRNDDDVLSGLKTTCRTIADLRRVCTKHNDSFYRDGWDWRVNKRNIHVDSAVL